MIPPRSGYDRKAGATRTEETGDGSIRDHRYNHNDRAAQAEYRARFPEVLATYGGRMMRPRPATGDETAPQPAVLEFGTVKQAMDWHLLRDVAPRQAEVREIRDRMGTVNRVYVVDGDDIG